MQIKINKRAVRDILKQQEDPDREGLLELDRVARMYEEIYSVFIKILSHLR